MTRALAMWLVGLGLALGGFAWAEDGAPAGGDAPKRPFRDRMGKGLEGKGEGRPEGVRPGGPGAGGPLGLIANDAPAVREEMKRHFKDMKSLLDETRTLAQQIRQEVGDLRKAGDEKPPADDVVKKHSAQAEEIAGKLAGLLATHHANLAKIYEEKQGDMIKKMGEDMLKRLAERRGPDGPGGPNGQGRPDKQGRRNRGDGPAGGPGGAPAPKTAPENF